MEVTSTPCAKPNKDVLGLERERVGGAVAEPLPVEEEEEVPSPVQQKKTSRRQRGQKKKKNRGGTRR